MPEDRTPPSETAESAMEAQGPILPQDIRKHWTIRDLPSVSLPHQGNRRVLPRVMGPFTVKCPKTGLSQVGIDLSFGGLMCLADDIGWKQSDTVSVELWLANQSEPLELSAQVAQMVSFRGKPAMRLRFADIDATQRDRIATWMSTVSRSL